ncbi:MAG: hypothetical protein AB7T27_01760 [Kiritimatiellia bacterium]
MRTAWIAVCLITAAAFVSAAEISDTVLFDDPQGGYILAGGQISLPASAFWQPVEGISGVREIYLYPSEDQQDRLLGVRTAAIERDNRIDQGRYAVSRLYWPVKEYADKHDGIGPSAVSGLGTNWQESAWAAVSNSPWGSDSEIPVEGPFVFLLPSVQFRTASGTERVSRENRDLLAVELRPYADDGKHWAAFTDGSTERIAIDQELERKHGIKITPVIKTANEERLQSNAIVYRILAVLDREASDRLELRFINKSASNELSAVWNRAGAPADAGLAERLKSLRSAKWQSYAVHSSSPVLQTWLNRPARDQRGGRRRRGAELSAFGLLGGRAAIQETLQMEAINDGSNPGDANVVPIESIAGVTVTSHPFEEMLAGAPGGRLPLADYIPADRFFVHCARPSTLLPFLNGGADFLWNMGSTMTGNSIKHNLKERYLGRLGINEQWLKMLLDAGIVKETALMFPDLFFIDNTEVSSVSRLAQPGAIGKMLELIGIRGIGAGTVEKVTARGNKVWWALRGDLLFISTSRSELDSMLALLSAGGAGSLGQSVEFRYMLTQLPESGNTRMLAYFSDPFIRRLVGPSVKIAQLRRLKARAKMEVLAARGLLNRLNGIAPEARPQDGYVIGDDLIVRSETFGTLHDMATLSSVDVSMVTTNEQAAYRQYVDNYSRYWRQYFDPIAMRLDDGPAGQLELTTFILPLIDNTAYNGIREWAVAAEDAAPLEVPEVNPPPVMMLSLNIKERGWREILKGFLPIFSRYTHINPAILDDWGTSLHLAVHDADPVIALGSGDVLGAFGSFRMMGGRGEMLMIPLMFTLLTRPCTLAIETGNPARTLDYLRRASRLTGSSDDWEDEVGIEFTQIEGKDEWVCVFDIMGTLKLRYGLEVDGNYVLIRNIPWSDKGNWSGARKADLQTIQLQLFPGACSLQLPGLHMASMEGSRSAAFEAMGFLYPLVSSGYCPLTEAESRHEELFGFRPVHPSGGVWQWEDNQLQSSVFGSVYRPRQPAHEGGGDFGLMREIEFLRLNMQFEDAGLRTKVVWKKRP